MLPHWLGLYAEQADSALVRGALGAYAAYRTTNAARHMGGLGRDDAKRAFRQAILEGTAGHAKAKKLLRACMVAGVQVQPAQAPSELKRRRLTIQERFHALHLSV